MHLWLLCYCFRYSYVVRKEKKICYNWENKRFLSDKFCPAPTFIEVVSDPLGDHEYDHDGEAVGHVPRRLDQDDRQRDGHPHHAS